MIRMKNHRIRDWIVAAFVIMPAVLICVPARAEPSIAVLLSYDLAPYQAMLDGFKQYFNDKGIEANYAVMQASGDKKKAIQLAQEIDQQNTALIYCLGVMACQSVQQLDQPRPVVASLVLTAESIAQLAQGTGVFLNYLPETQLQWHKKLFPQLRRIGVIYNPEQNQKLIDEAAVIAGKLGLELITATIDSPKEIPSALKYLLRDVDVLWAVPDKTALTPQTVKQVLLTSFRNRIPVIGISAPWVKSGALYALDWDYTDIGAQNAAMALHAIQGTPVSMIPAVEPRSVAYTLNLKTAEHMRLDMLDEISLGAKNVYQ